MSTTTFSIGRTARLTRWNATLLVRNRAAFFYATVMPLLPLALLFTGERGDPVVGANAVTTCFLVAGLFPVYYNVLSQFVGRREELVLKRMRTGETRDTELLVSIALPGAMCALVICAVVVPVAWALDQPLPLNPLIYVVLSLVTVTMFSAFAYWTAAWTRSAEAAQLTSMPIIFLASLGPLFVALPGLSTTVREVVAWTPGAAMAELVGSSWFGFDRVGATEPSLSLAETWAASAEPLLVMAAWTVIGLWLARRSMRWEPRT